MSDRENEREWFATAVPFKLRAVHKWYAETFGYFWLPCPLCGQDFGGHEWHDIDGLPSSIPDPDYEPSPEAGSRGIGICPTCTRAGRGKRP